MGRQPNPMIGTRVPVEWKVQIEALATATGRNSSQVVYEAIAQYLGKADAPTLGSQMQDMLSRISALEQQQAALRVLLAK